MDEEREAELRVALLRRSPAAWEIVERLTRDLGAIVGAFVAAEVESLLAALLEAQDD